MILRKIALLALSAVPMLAAAQTQDNPQVLVEGQNSWTGESWSTVYFKYTPQEDVLVTLDGISSATVMQGGTEISRYTTSTPAQVVFMAKKSTEYILSSFSMASSMNFTATFTPHAYNDGQDCSDPIVAGSEPVFMPCMSTGGMFGTKIPVFVRYNVPEDGRLEVSFTVSPNKFYFGSDCDSQFTELELKYSGGEYKATVDVEQGDSYLFRAEATSAVMGTFRVVQVVPGSSCEDAWTAVAGDNVIPKEAGTYWYTFKAPAVPSQQFVEISSEADCSVELTSSCGSTYGVVSCEAIALRTSLGGGDSRILKIVKSAATAEDEHFTLAFVAPGEIDTESVGLPIEAGQKYTTPAFGGTYYYSFTSPAAGNWFADVRLSVPAVSGSSMALYEKGGVFPVANGTSVIHAEIKAETEYVLKLICPNSFRSVPFELSFAEVLPGQTESNPLTAVIGDNNVPAWASVYLSYTSEKSSWIVVATSGMKPAVKVKDGMSTQLYEVVGKENSWRFEAVSGTVYIFSFADVADPFVMNLAAVDYAAGESSDNPVDVEGDSYTLPSSTGKTWLRYTPSKDGFLVVSTTLAYDRSNQVLVYVGEVKDANRQQLPTNGDYSNLQFATLRTAVKSSEPVFVCVSVGIAQEGAAVMFELQDPGEGETPATAIEIPITGDPTVYTMTTLNYGDTRWYYFNANEGQLSMTANGYYEAELYYAEDMDNPVATVARGSDYFTYGFTDVALTGGKYYVKLTRLSADKEITLSGSAIKDVLSGVGSVMVPEILERTWWTIDGRRIDAPTPGEICISKTVYSDGTVRVVKVIE